MPSLNQLIDAKATGKRGKGGRRYDSYGPMKREWHQYIQIHARQQEFPKLEGPHDFFFEHRELNKARDPDNFVAAGHKLIFDALQEAGLMENDGWKQVASFQDQWVVDRERPGVLLTVSRAGDYDG